MAKTIITIPVDDQQGHLSSNNNIVIMSNDTYRQVQDGVDVHQNAFPLLTQAPRNSSQQLSSSIPVEVNPASTSVESNFPSRDIRDIFPQQPIPPLPTATPAQDRIIIKGNFTPQSPLSVEKNVITSNEILPFPPPLSDPYEPKDSTILNTEVGSLNNNDRIVEVRQNQSNPNERISSTQKQSSRNNYQYVAPEPISISPFNQTPQDDPTLSGSGTKKTRTTIDISPNHNQTQSSTNPSLSSPREISSSSTTANPVNTNTNTSTIIKPNYVNSSQKRRTLTDILIFAGDDSNKNNNSSEITSLRSSPSYKVLVLANNQSVENQVKWLYPDAFRTRYQGKNFLQVGLFSDQVNAQQVINILQNHGLNPLIITD